MTTSVIIGVWIERKEREIQRCPSYYAADYEVIRTTPGEYPLHLTFQGGYKIPMPYWILCKVDGRRTEGRLYSGFGGVNYSYTELPKEPTEYPMQMYCYSIPELVRLGTIRLDPKYNWLMEKNYTQHPDCPKKWEDIQ